MSHPVSIFPDQFRLDGRTALITGSGRGLGFVARGSLLTAGGNQKEECGHCDVPMMSHPRAS